jgi:hypothetical protein
MSNQNSPNTQPIFIRQPTIHSLVLQTELGQVLPTSTLVPKTLLVGSDPGTAIETIEIQPTGLMVATTLNLYLYDLIGTQQQSRLIRQVDLPAITVAGSQQPISVLLPATLSPVNNLSPSKILRLPNGWELRAALSVAIANPIIVTAFGGSYY